MKLILKQNLFFFILTSCSIFLFAALYYYLHICSSETQKLISDVRDLENDLVKFRDEIVAFDHVSSDGEVVEQDISLSVEAEKEISLFLKYLFNKSENVFEKWTSKSAESVNASLTRLFSRLRRKCRESFINLPNSSIRDANSDSFLPISKDESGKAFGFSFSAYDGYWPNFSNDEARKLGVQSEIIKELIEHLSFCADSNHSIEILSLKRESVGSVDKKNIGEDELDISNVNSEFLRELDEVESYIFKLTLKTQTIPLRNLVNKLRPPFLIREIAIIPVGETRPNDFTIPSNTPDPFSLSPVVDENFLPIVSKVDSKVDLILEYVTSSNRNLDSIFQSLSRRAYIQPDILYNWLKETGNEPLIHDAKGFFNEKINR